MNRKELLSVAAVAALAVASGAFFTGLPLAEFLVQGAIESARTALYMAWITWWALVLGFSISGAVEAWIPAERISSSLHGSGPQELALASFYGFVSSSCSYSAISTSKNIFKKGASAASSLGAFMFASTNFVIEIGLVIWILLGWQFVAANFLGGLFLIVLMALGFRYLVPQDLIDEARRNALGGAAVRDPVCGMEVDPSEAIERDIDGSRYYFCSEECASGFEPDDDVRSVRDQFLSAEGWKRMARSQWKEWKMLYDDIAVGFVLAGIIAGFVPQQVWTGLAGTEAFSGIALIGWSAAAGTLIGVATFVCSVGNVPFGATLWSRGFPFGSILSYIYADLIVPPIVNAYREYYGSRFAAALSGLIFGAAVISGIAVHLVFGYAGLIPEPSGFVPEEHAFGLDYRLALNLAFSAFFLALYRLKDM